VKRAYGTPITANIATASKPSTANTAAGSDSVAATKPSTRNPHTTAPAQPYGRRGGSTGSSGTPGRFRTCRCTTSESLRAVQNHHSPPTTTSKPATTRNGKRGEFARYQQATPAHNMVAAVNRTQNVPSMRMRMLRASSTSCCAIPMTNPAAQASRSQRTSPAQTDVIPANNARMGHARARNSRDMCDLPRDAGLPYRFSRIDASASTPPGPHLRCGL
jgi:hypothetical protein